VTLLGFDRCGGGATTRPAINFVAVLLHGARSEGMEVMADALDSEVIGSGLKEIMQRRGLGPRRLRFVGAGMTRAMHRQSPLALAGDGSFPAGSEYLARGGDVPR